MKYITIKNITYWIGISFFLLFPLLFLGSIHLGPISIRLIVSYGLLGYVIWRGYSDYMMTRDMRMYFIYLIVYIFINLISFSFFEITFIKDLIAVHFVCCIIIFAFPRIFKTEASIRSAYIILFAGFLLNAIATILQGLNMPIGWAIGMAINPLEMEDLEEMRTTIDSEDLSKSFIMGIMGRSVGNGYFVSTMLPVMTYYIWDKLKIKTLWIFFIFTISILCIYFIQQRMAVVVTASYILSIILIKKVSALTSFFAVLAMILLLVIYFDNAQSIDYTQFGRLSNMSDSYRTSTLSILADFLNDPSTILLGHNQKVSGQDYLIFRSMGHNSFLGALRLGGIFLLLTYIILFIYLCKTLYDIAVYSHQIEDYRTFGMTMGCFCYLLYSQTHSTGVQSGSILFWTLYMLTIQSHRVKSETIEAIELEKDTHLGTAES